MATEHRAAQRLVAELGSVQVELSARSTHELLCFSFFALLCQSTYSSDIAGTEVGLSTIASSSGRSLMNQEQSEY